MSDSDDTRQIESVGELVEDFSSRTKPRDGFLVGAEFEFFGVEYPEGRPLAYAGERGISSLFERLAARGWEAELEDGRAIALSRGGASLTLEPGGQVELAGSPGADLDSVRVELGNICGQLVTAGAELGLRFYQCGRQPFFELDDIPWVPKGRYGVMRSHLGQRGSMAHRMMKETGSIQVSLDFDSEEDLCRKFQLVSRLSPVTAALFANSAVACRKPTGMLCERALIWRNTDPARCGLIPGAFEEGFGFQAHVDNALDTPMMFLYRDGWLQMPGISFRDYLADGYEGHSASWTDWNLHLSGIFTDVRLKSYLEIRTADALPWPLPMTVPAFWVGLLYDDNALEKASELVAGWSFELTEALVGEVVEKGLGAEARGRPLRALAEQLVGLAQDGLPESQRKYLTPLADQLSIHQTAPAVQFVEAWESDWVDNLEGFLEVNGLERVAAAQ